MDTEFLKINKQCLQNLMEINGALSAIETKGDSTMVMYKIRLTLSSTLEQMQKDNQVEDKPTEIDNTKTEIKDKEKEDKT